MGSFCTGTGAWPESSGHVPVGPGGPRCGCGAEGCWEVHASSRAALRYYEESAPSQPAGTIDELLRLAGEDEPKAVAALTRQAEAIGRGLRLISATLAPEVILIAGDIVSAWARFGPLIEQAFSGVVLAGLKPRLMPTHEAELARLRGAAIVVLQRRSSHREEPVVVARNAEPGTAATATKGSGSAARLTCSGGVAADPFDDGAHGDSGGALGQPRLGFLGPGAAGDVKVDPRGVGGELLEEHGGGDGSAGASAAVHDVADTALDQLAVVVGAGQAPELHAGFARGRP